MDRRLKIVFQPQNYSKKLSLESLFQRKKRHYLERSVAEDRQAELHNNHHSTHVGNQGNTGNKSKKNQTPCFS